MGVRTQLTELGNRPDGKTFEIWEEADGSIAVTAGGNSVVTAKTDPLNGGLELSAGSLKLTQTAAKLVAAFEAQAQENVILGHYLEVRAGLSVNDTPTITGLGGGLAPSADPTDPAAQRINLFGSAIGDTNELTLAQSLLGKKWVRGFSPGAYNWVQGGCFRLSSALMYYNANTGDGLGQGDQDTRPSDHWSFSAGIYYIEFVLDSDVVYTRILTGHKFTLWVNDNLVSGVGNAGTNMTYDSANIKYVPNIGGHGYTKIKFPTVARRRIRIAIEAGSTIGDLWTRSISTLTPRCETPLEWVHFGDSFSQYSGVNQPYRTCLSEYLNSAFGRNINFINVGVGGTSFANPVVTAYEDVPIENTKSQFYNQFMRNWQQCSPDVVTCLVGHNDTALSSEVLTPKVVQMLQAIRAKFPATLIVCFTTNSSPGIISGGADVAVEQIMISAIQTAGVGALIVPMQSNANPYGAFLRGTGKVTATTGVGNTDVYICSDGTHPSPEGHKAYGTWMSERMYEVLRANFLL